MITADRYTLERLLVRLTHAAWALADSTEEVSLTVDSMALRELCAVLDDIDALPEVPGAVADAAAKVDHWLRWAEHHPMGVDSNSIPRSQGGDGL